MLVVSGKPGKLQELTAFRVRYFPPGSQTGSQSVSLPPDREPRQPCHPPIPCDYPFPLPARRGCGCLLLSLCSVKDAENKAFVVKRAAPVSTIDQHRSDRTYW